MNFNNSSIKRKNPINRNNLFMSEEQFHVQASIGMEYANKVLNQTVVLYEVDLEKTNLNDTYKESDFDNIIFKTPVELNVIYKLDKHELKTYDKTGIKGYYAKVGRFEFSIFTKELEENDCDIKRGDYIGLQVNPEHMEYFIVTDDGRVNFDNAHTLWGTVPFYRSIKCAVVSDITETKNL
jgi:hypothetical protein